MSDQEPPRPADGSAPMEFADTIPVELPPVFHDDERTENLLRRLAEREEAMPEARRIELAKEPTDWRQVAADIAAQLVESRTIRALTGGFGSVFGAAGDWVFGFGRWLRQASERRESLLASADEATARVENAWKRFQRKLGGRVEALRFVRDPKTLTYSFERAWTDLVNVPANSQSYGMATIAIRRFGRVSVIMHGVDLAEQGLRTRLTRRKGLMLFRLRDERGATMLLTAGLTILLLSQYREGPVSLARLVARLEDQPKEVRERLLYKPSPELLAQIKGEGAALRQQGILKSGRHGT